MNKNPTRKCKSCKTPNMMTRRVETEEDAEQLTKFFRENNQLTQRQLITKGDEICIICQHVLGELELKKKTPLGHNNTLHPDVEIQQWNNTKLPHEHYKKRWDTEEEPPE